MNIYDEDRKSDLEDFDFDDDRSIMMKQMKKYSDNNLL